ncbi:MAG: glycosyltransferase family 2 protein [Nitrospina sp.]|nr:glycosyltransferase family 2 protein [Nitrospina sp.]MBT6602033.1 glycosyltransferase family 2 protein [Nitrospina sp.]
MKKVTAIIVNWNDKNVIDECIQSLLDQDRSEIEVIISDNGSKDGSIEYLQRSFPSIKIIENGKNLGFGSAINKGLVIAKGDYIIFLNSDLKLNPKCIGELVKLLESDSNIGGAIPKILHIDQQNTINSLGVLINFTGIAYPNLLGQKDPDWIEPFESACGGIFMLRREVYETVGGFDEDLFLYHEDHDLSWRIRLAGWYLKVNPKATMYHHYKFNKGVRKYYSSEKNRLYLLVKNMEVKTLVLIFPALLIVEISQLFHAAINNWFFLKAKSYIELLALLPRILVKRKKQKHLRRVPDKEITRIYQGTLAVSGIKNPLLTHLLSPLLNTYWRLIRHLV